MDLYRIKLIGITVILLFSGCREPEKDELTLPGKIRLKILLTGNGPDYLMFGGNIGIQRIRFEGKREVGEDVYFETDPTMNFQTISIDINPVQISTFDIPRGVYNYMKWDIDLKKIVPTVFNDSLDFDTLKLGLIIYGQYDWGYGEEKPNPVIFAIDDTVKLSFMSGDEARFELSENKDCSIFLSLDTRIAFNPLSRDSIEKLETTGPRLDKIVLISGNKNQDVYKDLLYRILQSLKLSVF